MKVERLHSRNVVGISRSETIRHAAATMRRFHVGEEADALEALGRMRAA